MYLFLISLADEQHDSGLVCPLKKPVLMDPIWIICNLILCTTVIWGVGMCSASTPSRCYCNKYLFFFFFIYVLRNLLGERTDRDAIS